ncbi:MAG: hypothetical protein JSV64_07045 [Candidatus Bathyarchaeota archaeon]|nr:MAG: hypothetical protein JSV64_07045 [Candidatus Bathyarchaeota archaeon]
MLRTRRIFEKNRSRFEIIAEILRNLRVPICWTNIMSHCNISSRQSGRYFDLLRSSGFIQKQVAAGKVTYQRTDAGREFLKHYNKIVLLLDPSVAPPVQI